MEETIIAQNLPYITYLHKSDQPPIPDFRPLNNIALQATKPYQDGEFSFGIDLKFTEGMSGGVSGGCMTKPSRFRHLIGKRRNLSGLLPRAPIRATKVRVTIFGAQKSDV